MTSASAALSASRELSLSCKAAFWAACCSRSASACSRASAISLFNRSSSATCRSTDRASCLSSPRHFVLASARDSWAAWRASRSGPASSFPPAFSRASLLAASSTFCTESSSRRRASASLSLSARALRCAASFCRSSSWRSLSAVRACRSFSSAGAGAGVAADAAEACVWTEAGCGARPGRDGVATGAAAGAGA